MPTERKFHTLANSCSLIVCKLKASSGNGLSLFSYISIARAIILRQDFNAETKRAIANRVNSVCSNPDCRATTSGPNEDPIKAVNIGVAAHITAASEGGPRFDYTLSLDERVHASNGIWLCQNCGKLVDNDPTNFTVEKLRKWREDAELVAQHSLGKTYTKESQLQRFSIHTLSPTAVAGHTTVALDVNVFKSGAFTLPSYLSGVVIAFENRHVSPGDVDVSNVWAEVILRERGLGMEMSRLPSACWLDHPQPEIDFPLNMTRYLFLGGWEVKDKAFVSDIQLFEFNRSLNRPVERKPTFQGYPHDLIVDVTLTPNGFHEFAQRFQFSLKLLDRGLYSIRPISGLTS